VGDVRRVLRRWLEANGASDDEVNDVLVATSEAQTNAVRHAYRWPDGAIEVEAAIESGLITVTVRDRGTWRPPILNNEGDGGRGLALIDQLMNVDIDAGERGTEIRMRRRLGAQR
jgi:anti-sigma regulatory factor (Ser/Thr protein kinase)